MKIYHTATQEDYNALMIELEAKGYKWCDGDYLNVRNNYQKYKSQTTIVERECEKTIQFGNVSYNIQHNPDVRIIEYKAKGDKQMLNTECKQCHKKWHHENAKYCSMCGKKLVDDPEFKAGDIVSSEILPDGCGIVRLEEDLTNELSEVYGIWYTNNDCEIQEVAFTVFKEDTRHATPEEIAEYEAALTFHKHGRKPFEVKKDDILLEVGDSKLFVNVPDFCSKKDFVSGGYTLFKTAEEVNEWLGADNE